MIELPLNVRVHHPIEKEGNVVQSLKQLSFGQQAEMAQISSLLVLFVEEMKTKQIYGIEIQLLTGLGTRGEFWFQELVEADLLESSDQIWQNQMKHGCLIELLLQCAKEM
jgi:hypothetical protein